MNAGLLSALESLEREKGISKEVLFSAIESALTSAAIKIIGGGHGVSKEDISVTVNKETGEVKVYVSGTEVDSEQFGRIAAQTAKQVMIQKIREAERNVISDKYLQMEGDIVSGSVHRFEKGNTIIQLDDTEAVLSKTEQIPGERFRQGEMIRALLLKVDKKVNGLEIVLSRAHSGFVKKLFELEVPEIAQGIVEIKAIAREPGERTKISVYSRDDKVDSVGACVGMRGSRVKEIVKEISGERIDIVRWSNDLRDYVKAAVSPVEIESMEIDRDGNEIKLSVPREQLSLLIGKKGRNIRLASKLLGWELKAEGVGEDVAIGEVEGIDAETLSVLTENGFETAAQVLQKGVDELAAVAGFGNEKAVHLIEFCQKALAAAGDAPEAEEAAAQEEPEAAPKEEKRSKRGKKTK